MYVRNYQPGRGWLPGEVQERKGPVSMQDGRLHRCHLDQVWKRSVEEPSASDMQVDAPNSRTDVLPVLSVELAQPSAETSASEECLVELF